MIDHPDDDLTDSERRARMEQDSYMQAVDEAAPRRVLVCGSRTYPENDGMLRSVLVGLDIQAAGIDAIIEGGACGADLAAAAYAEGMLIRHEQYTADWSRYGRGAGLIRNQRMLDEGKPDLVLAFVDKPLAESRGTADMVSRAIMAGVPTYVVQRCWPNDETEAT